MSLLILLLVISISLLCIWHRIINQFNSIPWLLSSVAARGRKNKRCCKRQNLTSLLNCGNPNAYYRNVKFAVQRAKTTHQKNQGVAAFLFKFCFFSLYCSWCSCLRHHYCCNSLRLVKNRISLPIIKIYLRRYISYLNKDWWCCYSEIYLLK